MIVLVTAAIVITGYFVYAYNDAMNAATEPDDALSQLEQNLQEEYKDGYPSLEKYYDCNSEYRNELNYLFDEEYISYKIIDNTIYVKYDISKKGISEENLANSLEKTEKNTENLAKEVCDDANKQSNIEEISFKYEFYNNDKYITSFDYTYAYPKSPEN